MTNAVHGWDQRVYVGLESAWLTRAVVAAANAIQVQSLDFGDASGVGNTRPRKDKTQGRDETLGFVEGRVEPIPFSIDKPIMSRATAATAPEESPILKAAGLTETIGASVAYTIGTTNPSSLWLLSVLGAGSLAQQGEHGLGGVVKQLQFSGGDSELMLKASGAVARKNWLGQFVGTLVDASDLTLVADTAADIYRAGEGYYQSGSEAVEVTATNFTGNSHTVARAIAGTVAAAHVGQAFYPYNPTPAPVGVAAISEANCTVTLDSIATRCTKFSIDITTGVDHLPGETGSKYAQGLKLIRTGVKVSLELVLTRELVALLGKANQRKSVALSIVCGTGAGSIVTFSFPTCEVEGFPVAAPSNDVSVVSPGIRVRGSSGNDSFSVTFS
jgi:hypothetical protein